MRARTLDDRNPHVLDTQAQALMCVGDFIEAETAARMALSGRPEHAGAVLTLARVLLGQSRLAEAQEQLDRADQLLRRDGSLDEVTLRELNALRGQIEQRRSQSTR